MLNAAFLSEYLFSDLFLFMNMCEHLCEQVLCIWDMYMGMPEKCKNSVTSSGVGVPGGSQLPNIGAKSKLQSTAGAESTNHH